jgi:adenosine kinase
MIYFEGFFLRSSVKSLDQIIDYSVASQKPVGVNLSSLPIIQDYFSFFERHLPHFDYIFCNEGEAYAFAKAKQLTHLSLEEVARTIAREPKVVDSQRVVVITRGAQPVIVATQARVFTVEVPLLDERLIVDKNGAGDAFTGGFLAAAVSDCDLERCTDAGLYAANEIIQASGCQFINPCTFSLSI